LNRTESTHTKKEDKKERKTICNKAPYSRPSLCTENK